MQRSIPRHLSIEKHRSYASPETIDLLMFTVEAGRIHHGDTEGTERTEDRKKGKGTAEECGGTQIRIAGGKRTTPSFLSACIGVHPRLLPPAFRLEFPILSVSPW